MKGWVDESLYQKSGPLTCADPPVSVWENDSPHARFWRRLLNENVDKIISDREHLRKLRFANDLVKNYQRRLGHIFEERGLNLYQLIAEAHNECWDSEDDQKTAPVPVQKPKEKVVPMEVKKNHNAVSLDHPRQVGVRRREEEECLVQVRSSDEGCKIQLHAERCKSV